VGLGRKKDAVAAYKQALDLKPDLKYVQRQLMLLREKQDDREGKIGGDIDNAS